MLWRIFIRSFSEIARMPVLLMCLNFTLISFSMEANNSSASLMFSPSTEMVIYFSAFKLFLPSCILSRMISLCSARRSSSSSFLYCIRIVSLNLLLSILRMLTVISYEYRWLNVFRILSNDFKISSCSSSPRSEKLVSSR